MTREPRNARSAWRNMKLDSRWFDSSVYASFINGVSSSGLKGRGNVPCISHDFHSFSQSVVWLWGGLVSGVLTSLYTLILDSIAW